MIREGGPQRFVAPRQLADRSVERRDVERPSQTKRRRDVVGCTSGFELIEKPEPLLRERQGNGSIVESRLQPGLDRRKIPASVRAKRPVERFGEARDSGGREKHAQRKVGAKDRPDARHHAGGQQRVSAEVEEIIAGADALDPQDVFPDVDEHRFGSGPGRHDLAGWSQAGIAGRRERLAIDFAVRSKRQGVEPHEEGRNEMLGQPLAQKDPQSVARNRRTLGPHDERDQLETAVVV